MAELYGNLRVTLMMIALIFFPLVIMCCHTAKKILQLRLVTNHVTGLFEREMMCGGLLERPEHCEVRIISDL